MGFDTRCVHSFGLCVNVSVCVNRCPSVDLNPASVINGERERETRDSFISGLPELTLTHLCCWIDESTDPGSDVGLSVTAKLWPIRMSLAHHVTDV